MERSYGKEQADGIVAVCQTHWMFSRSAKIGKGRHSKCMGKEQHEEIEKGVILETNGRRWKALSTVVDPEDVGGHGLV